MNLAAEQIAKIVGSPKENAIANWPLLLSALTAIGCASDCSLIAAAATIRVECPAFKPMREIGGPQYFTKLYDITSPDPHRADLAHQMGNTTPGDGPLYCGRGFVQLTWKSNYEKFGKKIGVDLVAKPDAALDPANAARLFAEFWAEHHIAAAAESHDFVKVRKLINGGTNGLKAFLVMVRLLAEAAGMTEAAQAAQQQFDAQPKAMAAQA